MTIEELAEEIKSQTGSRKTEAQARLWEMISGLIRLKAETALQSRPDLIDDLLQELFISMAKAAESFDPAAGCSFLTYYLNYYFPRAYRLVRYGSITPGAENRPDNIAVSLSEPATEEEGGRTLADNIEDPEALAAFELIENEAFSKYLLARIRECIRDEPDNISQSILWQIYETAGTGSTNKERAAALDMSYAYYMGKRDKAIKRLRVRLLNKITPEERIDFLAEIMDSRTLTRGTGLRLFRERVNTSEVECLAIKAADMSINAYGIKPAGMNDKK